MLSDCRSLVCDKIARDGIWRLLVDSTVFGCRVARSTPTWIARYEGTSRIDGPKVLSVDPDAIRLAPARRLRCDCSSRHICVFERPYWYKLGKVNQVFDGAWDQWTVPFSRTVEYRSLEQRILHDAAWEETRLYERSLNRIERGESVYGCRTREQLERRLSYLDELHESIRRDGYRTNAETDAGFGEGRVGPASVDEVVVDIGRDGELYYHTNGRHRLAIAKLTDVRQIPVVVRIRHAEWQAIRDEIRSTDSQDLSDELEARSSHPDLQDLR